MDNADTAHPAGHAAQHVAEASNAAEHRSRSRSAGPGAPRKRSRSPSGQHEAAVEHGSGHSRARSLLSSRSASSSTTVPREGDHFHVPNAIEIQLEIEETVNKYGKLLVAHPPNGKTVAKADYEKLHRCLKREAQLIQTQGKKRADASCCPTFFPETGPGGKTANKLCQEYWATYSKACEQLLQVLGAHEYKTYFLDSMDTPGSWFMGVLIGGSLAALAGMWVHITGVKKTHQVQLDTHKAQFDKIDTIFKGLGTTPEAFLDSVEEHKHESPALMPSAGTMKNFVGKALPLGVAAAAVAGGGWWGTAAARLGFLGGTGAAVMNFMNTYVGDAALQADAPMKAAMLKQLKKEEAAYRNHATGGVIPGAQWMENKAAGWAPEKAAAAGSMLTNLAASVNEKVGKKIKGYLIS